MTYRLYIFDFDGTLADRHGFRRLPRDEIERLRGRDTREGLEWAGPTRTFAAMDEIAATARPA